MELLTRKINYFIKTETVLCIAFIAAVLTMVIIQPSAEYITYIDFRVLSLLFSLMAVVAGFNKTGVFIHLCEKLLKKVHNTRSLCFVLIMLCFFTSMWITNDVALLTFVPFAILLLTMTKQTKYIIFVIVLQTIAANLGSMLTPVGNPQNLFLYSFYWVPINEFMKITFPYTVFSFLLLSALVFTVKKEALNFELPQYEPIEKKNQKWLIALYSVLFLVCLACVLRLIDYRITLLIVAAVILLFDRSVIMKVDYSLLLTFVCFFVFVGNIGHITIIKDFLVDLMKGRELLLSVVASQGISNVPAAVLFSAFTNDYKSLIIGTNIGGLGTLVASLASLISYKIYCKSEDAKPSKFLKTFTIYNIIFLIALLLFYKFGHYMIYLFLIFLLI